MIPLYGVLVIDKIVWPWRKHSSRQQGAVGGVLHAMLTMLVGRQCLLAYGNPWKQPQLAMLE